MEKIQILEKRLDDYIGKYTGTSASVEKLMVIVVGGKYEINGKVVDVPGLIDRLDSLEKRMLDQEKFRKKTERNTYIIAALIAGAVLGVKSIIQFFVKIFL